MARADLRMLSQFVALEGGCAINIQTSDGVVQGLSHPHCTLLQCGDGYGNLQQSNTDAGRDRAEHDALCLPGMHAEVSRARHE